MKIFTAFASQASVLHSQRRVLEFCFKEPRFCMVLLAEESVVGNIQFSRIHFIYSYSYSSTKGIACQLKSNLGEELMDVANVHQYCKPQNPD